MTSVVKVSSHFEPIAEIIMSRRRSSVPRVYIIDWPCTEEEEHEDTAEHRDQQPPVILQTFKCHIVIVLFSQVSPYERLVLVFLFTKWHIMLTSATRRMVNTAANIQNVVTTDDAGMSEIAAHVGSRS